MTAKLKHITLTYSNGAVKTYAIKDSAVVEENDVVSAIGHVVDAISSKLNQGIDKKAFFKSIDKSAVNADGTRIDMKLYKDYKNLLNDNPYMYLHNGEYFGEIHVGPDTPLYNVRRYTHGVGEMILAHVNRSIVIDFMYKLNLTFKGLKIPQYKGKLFEIKVVCKDDKDDDVYYTVRDMKKCYDIVNLSTPEEDGRLIGDYNIVDRAVYGADNRRRFTPVEEFTGTIYNISGRWVVNAHKDSYREFTTVENGMRNGKVVKVYLDNFYTIKDIKDL